MSVAGRTRDRSSPFPGWIAATVWFVLSLSMLVGAVKPASAQSTWVLWVEAPLGSDQWGVARVGESRFRARYDCERHAASLNELEENVARMEGMTGSARDTFTCLPDTVDPRPESALPSR